jgi:2-hydroxy-3-oxopropionate reductase
MLPDSPDVELVLFGKDGVAEGLSKGKLVIDMSSISPLATSDFARRIAGLGCDYLDAPVSGGEVGAKNAALSIMIGGPKAAVERARPLFEAMGKSIVHVGPNNGDGQVAKCANQIVVALTIQAAAEGLLYAARAGADVEAVRKAILGGLGTSRILELHGERMIKRTMNPGFRIRLHQKDLNNALMSAREMALPLPATALAQQIFTTASANGGADLDHSALVTGLEAMANFRIGGGE